MLIGLTGYGGVGKITVARLLGEHRGALVQHIGAPNKAMSRALIGDFGYDQPTIAGSLNRALKPSLVP